MNNKSNAPKGLILALSKALGKPIEEITWDTRPLQGGTLGNVSLFFGLAQTEDGEKRSYRIVAKIQKKWERLGDPASWHREYDLYAYGFGNFFSGLLRLPVCYYREIRQDEAELWMEYIAGISGEQLTLPMLEQAAASLAVFQARFKHENPPRFSCFSDTGFMEREQAQWQAQTFDYKYLCSQDCPIPDHVRRMLQRNPWDNGKTIEYNYLRSNECDLPVHLKHMLIDTDDNREAIFAKIHTLPVLLCHRDFWLENIFWADEKIVLIDWDCAGWGYMGEDIASLIADDTETAAMPAYARRLVPAYYRSLAAVMEIPPVEDSCIWEMILFKFGYRHVQTHMFTESPAEKAAQADWLQKVYEIKTLLQYP